MTPDVKVAACKDKRASANSGTPHYFGKWVDPAGDGGWSRIPGGTFPSATGTKAKALLFAKEWALAELAERQRKAVLGHRPARTWAEMCDEYLVEIKQSIRVRGTAESEARTWAKRLSKDALLASKPLVDHDEDLVLAWLRPFAIEAVTRLGKTHPRAPRTTRNAVKVLRYVYDLAVRRKYIASNPARGTEVARELGALEDQRGLRPQAWVPLQDLRKLIRCKPIPWTARLRRMTAAYTSCGPGELHGLRVRSYVEKDGVQVLEVREQWLYPAKAYGPLKNEWRERDIPVHPVLKRALDVWLAHGWRKHVGRDPKPDDPLFPDADGKPWREVEAETFRQELLTAKCATECKGLTLVAYDLRHSFATLAREAKIAKDDRAYLMGHSAPDVEAAHYRVVLLPSLLEEVKKLPSLVAGYQDFGNRFGNGLEPSGDRDQPKIEAVPRDESEVRTGFEPAYDGFANHCLTAWLPHLGGRGI